MPRRGGFRVARRGHRRHASPSSTRRTLAHEALVEEAAYTAFHESAAANFPAEVLSPESEYLEAGRARGVWVPMPARRSVAVPEVQPRVQRRHPSGGGPRDHDVRWPAAERVPSRPARPGRAVPRPHPPLPGRARVIRSLASPGRSAAWPVSDRPTRRPGRGCIRSHRWQQRR